MQKQNVISIDYLENPARFADLLNGYVYHGQEMIKAEDVQELSSSVPRISKKKKGKQINAQVVTADIVRGVAVGMKAVIVALENQTDIHYAMPVRVMNLESSNYHRQWRKTYIKENSAEFEHLCEDAYDMISVMSHSGELMKYKQENINNEGGSNMCQAILEMIEEGRQEGIQEGIRVLVEFCQELGISKEDATLKVKEKYNLTEVLATEKIALYWVE